MRQGGTRAPATGRRWQAYPAPLLMLSLCLISWPALAVSLKLGRTTPFTASLEWLAAFLAAAAAVAAWTLIFGVTMWRASHLPDILPLARMVSIGATPLLLSVPLLVAVYLSDDAFHFLSNTPIPQALALWTPPLLMLACHTSLLVWNTACHPGMGSWLGGKRTAPLLIFATFASLYIFTAGGHLYSPDESTMYQVTRSLAERGSVAILGEGETPGTGEPGVRYSKYGLVPSLLALPPYWISSLIGPRPDPPSAAFPLPNDAYPLVDLLVGPLATAAACTLLWVTAQQLGFRATTSLVVVGLYGLATSAWVYSKTFFGQPAATLFLLAATCLLLRGSHLSARGAALAGLSLGLAVGTRVDLLLLAAPLALPLLAQLRRDPGHGARLLFAFALPFAATCLATVGFYNHLRYGALLDTGYGREALPAAYFDKPYIGLFGILFSSGFGWFVYNPIALLGVFSLPLLALRRRLEGYLFAALVALAVLFYGSFVVWYGGFTWASRYLVVVLPFAVLPVGALLERPWRSAMVTTMVAGTAALGMAVNLPAVLIDFNNGWQNLWYHNADLQKIQWDPHFSPIGAHVRLLRHFLYTGANLDLYVYFKLGLPSLLGFILLFVALATLAVRSSLLSEAAPSPDPEAPERDRTGLQAEPLPGGKAYSSCQVGSPGPVSVETWPARRSKRTDGKPGV